MPKYKTWMVILFLHDRFNPLRQPQIREVCLKTLQKWELNRKFFKLERDRAELLFVASWLSVAAKENRFQPGDAKIFLADRPGIGLSELALNGPDDEPQPHQLQIE
jgi:hypothetical protein